MASTVLAVVLTPADYIILLLGIHLKRYIRSQSVLAQSLSVLLEGRSNSFNLECDQIQAYQSPCVIQVAVGPSMKIFRNALAQIMLEEKAYCNNILKSILV